MPMQEISITSKAGEIIHIDPLVWERNKQQQELLLRYFACPLKEEETTIWLAVDNFANLNACEIFAFLTGKIIEPVQVATQDLKNLLQALNPSSLKMEEVSLSYEDHQQENINEKSEEPIIRLLDNIFETALKLKASDIHLEPQKDYLRLRFRIDGVMQTQPKMSLSLAPRLVSRLKLLAKLDISETRLPQDGGFHFKTTFSDLLDFRLSTLPTPLGEKAVLRLQQNKPVEFTFSELGMTAQQQDIFEQVLNQPQGLILVTGPTGSGKSISLYTALQYLNKPERHIMTAEDPIEIELEGIIQSQINPTIGLTFERLLRTFLRQDPDVIMLGEIRDEESAKMALRAAQTGHLVLSTLHTNDAISAISRLLQLGIQQHEIDSSLLLVIAQRLLRKSCQKCKTNTKNSNTDSSKCGVKKMNFCDCHQGYKGRVGIYQFLQPIYQNNQWHYQPDFKTLYLSALEKFHQQITDKKEIIRVLGQS